MGFFRVALLIFVLCAAPLAFGQDDWSKVSDGLPPDFGATLDENPDRSCVPDFVVWEFPYTHTADLRGAGNDCSFSQRERPPLRNSHHTRGTLHFFAMQFNFGCQFLHLSHLGMLRRDYSCLE